MTLSTRVGAAVLALTVLGGAVACSGAEPSGPGSPATGTAPSGAGPTARAELDGYLAKVKAVVPMSGPGNVVASDGRPSVDLASGTAVLVRDESAATHPAGRYRLTVYCAGRGTVVPFLGVGDRGQIGTELTCGPDTPTATLDVVAEKPGVATKVVVVPAGDTLAAIGYTLARLP